MNVTQIDSSELTITTFDQARERQLELMHDYAEIEGHPLFINSPLDARETQKFLKDMFWRVTEEVAESTETESAEHTKEEIVDAMHFILEACIAAGVETKGFTFRKAPTRVLLEGVELEVARWEVIRQLGLTANCLKNKAWKQTDMQTDQSQFRERLKFAWKAFMVLCCGTFDSDAELLEFYDRKSLVNKFRIRSKY